MNTETQNNTQNTETEPKAKRTRTSPRTKALDEVLSLIDAHITDLKEEAREGDSKDALAQAEVLSDVRGKIVSLADEGAPKLTYNGRHYLGVLATGERKPFDSNVPPTRRSHGPESKHAFSSVLGPFRTSEGVEYRIAHPDTACPVIFE